MLIWSDNGFHHSPFQCSAQLQNSKM